MSHIGHLPIIRLVPASLWRPGHPFALLGSSVVRRGLPLLTLALALIALAALGSGIGENACR